MREPPALGVVAGSQLGLDDPIARECCLLGLLLHSTEHPPASTLVAVAGLVDPRLLIEVAAIAVIP